MLYALEDIKKFSIQIKELLEKGLIHPSNGIIYHLLLWLRTKQKKDEMKQEWL